MTKLNMSLEWIIEPFALGTKIFLLEWPVRSEKESVCLEILYQGSLQTETAYLTVRNKKLLST